MMRSRAPIKRRCRASRTVSTKRLSKRGAPATRRRLHCWDGLFMWGHPRWFRGNPHARAKAGQALPPVMHVPGRESRHSVRKSAMSNKVAELSVRGAPPGRGSARVVHIVDVPDVPPSDIWQASASNEPRRGRRYARHLCHALWHGDKLVGGLVRDFP